MIPPAKSIIHQPEAKTPDAPDAPMSNKQADILRALAEEAGAPFDGGLTQQQAEERIAVLRDQLNAEE